jgi:predicted alpha/beta hydrolase family esterase
MRAEGQQSRVKTAGVRAKQLLFIQGGGKGAHDAWDDKLVASLERALGSEYAIRYPRMPDEARPDAAAWKEAIARELGQLGERAVLVGHSVGGAVLLDYLADAAVGRRMERRTEQRVAGVFLIATPFIGDAGWPSADLRPTAEAARELRGGPPISCYQGRDDETVPFAHAEMFATVFPGATIRLLQGRDHQLNGDLSEVAEDVRLLR